MENVVISTSTDKEHVAEIDITILTVEDSKRWIFTTMTFKYLQKIIITDMVYFSVLWLNAFPVKNVISKKLSPRNIVGRTNLDFKNAVSC